MKFTSCSEAFKRRFGRSSAAIWLGPVLFAGTLALRILFLNKGFFHHDAVLLVQAVEESVRQRAIVPFLDGRYGLVAFHVPFFLICQAFGLPVDVSFNFVTACLAALSVALLYSFAYELALGAFGAFASAALLSFMPVYFLVSTHTMVHPLSLALVLLSFRLLLRRSGHPSDQRVLWASLVLLFSISVRFPNVLLVPPFLVACLAPKFQRWAVRVDHGSSRRLLIALVPLCFGMSLIYFVQREALAAKAGYDAFLGLWSPVFKLALQGLYANLGLVGCALALVGFMLSFRMLEGGWAVALALWLGTMLFFYGNIRTFADRFLVVILPVLCIYVALALALTSRYSRIAALGLLIFLSAGMFRSFYPTAKERHEYSGEKAYALWVRERTEPQAVIIAMDDSVFIRYYAGRETMGHPQGSTEEAEEWAAQVAARLKAGVPMYLMESGLSYDPDRIIERTILRHFSLAYIGAHLTEDYHDNLRPFLQREVYSQNLFRLFQRVP